MERGDGTGRQVLVAVLCLCPVTVLAAGGGVLLRGGPAWAAVLAGLVTPTAVVAAALLVLAAATRRRTSGAVCPETEAVVPVRPVSLDLVDREVDLRLTEGALLRAVARTPAPEHDELLVLADRLRSARLEHAEVVLALGGDVEPELRRELDLRRRLPRSRPEVSGDELRKGLGEAP